MGPSLADRYAAQGFIRIEGIFSYEEIASARRSVAALPDWIRRLRGDRNVQRLQPLQSCTAVPDPGWIKSFYANRRLEQVIDRIFRGVVQPVPRMARDPQLTGLLIEPLDRWWSTGLHRDYRDFIADLDQEAWLAMARDPRVFNQVNIPLFADSSLWAVPGSHMRSDSEREARAVRRRFRYRECRVRAMGAEETAERRLELLADLEACGAVSIQAAPGDVVLYRNNMLHCGVYEPAVERLTLHDAIYSAEWHRYALDTVAGRPARSSGPAQERSA